MKEEHHLNLKEHIHTQKTLEITGRALQRISKVSAQISV